MPDEEIHFHCAGLNSAGVTLAGTFAAVPEPVAAALLITGSGKLNRDSDARTIKTRVTRQLADGLVAAQVSTLRYDKPGTGASGGSYLHAGMADNLAAARAAAAWLSEHAAGLPVFAVGHSEGTYYAAQLAADAAVAGAVLLGAPARSGQRIIEWQIEKLAPTLPRMALMVMRLIHFDFVRSQHKRLARLRASTTDVVRMTGVRVNARWFRDFLAYDPATVLPGITVPVLAITGGNDLQVPPEDTDAIGRLVGGPFEGHVLGDLNHLLRPDPDGRGLQGYRRSVRQPVSQELIEIINAWVKNCLLAAAAE